MAFIFQSPDEEEEAKKAAAAAGGTGAAGSAETTPPPITGSGSAVLSAGGGDTPPATPGQAQGPTNSGWTNLRAYLDANHEQAGDIADKISGNITSTGEEAKSGVEKGVADYNASLGSVPDAGGLAARASANPVDFSKNPGDVAAIKNFQSGSYAGPAPFEAQDNYGDLSVKAQKGADLATIANQEGGQRSMVKNLEPNLTEGDVSLNQLLLAGVPGARERISAAAAPYAGLKTWLGDQTTAADAARNAGEAKFNAGKATVKSNFVDPQTAALQKLEGGINSRASAASSSKTNSDRLIQDLEDYLSGKSSTLSSDEITQLGIPGADQGMIRSDAKNMLMQKFPNVTTNDQDAAAVTDAVLRDNYDNLPQRLRTTAQQLRAQYGNYDPLTQLKSIGVPAMSSYFPGLTRASGTPDIAGVATPDEVAKILSLQNLINGTATYLTPEQAAKAGSYKDAKLSKYQGAVPRNV